MRNSRMYGIAVLMLLATSMCLGQGRKDTDWGTISTSGSQLVFNDSLGAPSSTFEMVISGAPATVSIVTSGCMRSGTCDVLDTYTTVANSNRPINGVYDYYKVVASWTGGSTPSVRVNKLSLLAKRQSSGGGGVADPGANGIVKRTALNVLAVAVATDVTGLFSGTCNSTTYLRGDGQCFTPAGSGNVTAGILTTNKFPKASGATAIADSLASDDGTSFTYTGTGGFVAPKFSTNGAGAGTIDFSEGSPTTGAAGHEVCSADSATHALLCSFNGDTNLKVARTVAQGTSAMGTSAIGSAACATVVTTSATGVATTDAITVSFNADPTAVTGYVPSTSGGLTIFHYPTLNNVNFKVCNFTSASITPGAITLNWRVDR